MKTNMKRLLALILALSMVMSLLSTSAWAAESSEELSAMSTMEPQEESQEETQEETAPEPEEEEEEEEEEAQEEEPPEAEPEAEGEESEEEAKEAEEAEETETKPKEEQPKPKMKAKKQQLPGMSLTAYAEYVCPLCGSTNIFYNEEECEWFCSGCMMPFATPAESDGSQNNGVCPHCGSTDYEKWEDDDYYSCNSCGDWFVAPVEEVADDSSRIGSVYHTGDTLPKAFYYDDAAAAAVFLKQELAIYGLRGCVVDVDDVNALIFPNRKSCYLYFRSETARATDAVTAVKISSGGGSRENPYQLTPQYPVSFNANGGSPAPSAQQVWRGDKVTAPAAPTREGCEFAGWFNGNTQWDFNQNSVDYPITLTAHWNVPVTSVSLPDTATLTVDGEAVALTATVEPAEATDKTVKWSTTGGVTLYSDENCTAGNEIGTDATSTLTVYAKGISAGSATVTATSNADSNKSASCNVTVTAAASDNPYASLLNTTTVVKFDNKDWYLIENNSTALNAGTVTLLAKECVGSSQYNASGSFDAYESNPTVKTAVVNWYNDNITAAAKTAVSDNAMFLLTKDQANAMTGDTRKCSKASGANGNYWWLCSPCVRDDYAACVSGGNGDVNTYGNGVTFKLGVRPALKLDLSKVTFDSETKTFTVGSAATAHTHDDITFTAWDSDNSLPTESGSYYLTQDVTLSGTWNVPTGETNLCLNGNSIILSGSGSVISVPEGATLNLYDCDETTHYVTLTGGRGTDVSTTQPNGTEGTNYLKVTGGCITGGTGTSSNGRDYGGGVYVNGGTFTMSGGTIIGNTANYGGGVYVNGGTFTMSGGTIIGNTVNYGGGGGVYNNCGSFTMQGGEITGNKAQNGGGVYNNSTFTMQGGEITGNTTGIGGNGGGVYVQDGSFTMTGGNIVGNKTGGYGSGGGVYVNKGSFNLSGGSITDNTAYGNGGGVYNYSTFTMEAGSITGNKAQNGGGVYNNGTFTMTGAPVIKDNTKGTGESAPKNNVYLYDSKITVNGALSGSAEVGVTMKTPGVFTSSADPIKASGYKDCFSSDDSTYTVTTDGNELKLSSHEHDFTYSATGATITATCTVDGCALPPSSQGGTDHVAKLTIAAPTLGTYGQTGGGISAEATVTDASSIKGNATVVYKKGDETLSSAPTNAGTYTASITVGGATASVEYTIAQKEVTVSGITASDKVYDGNTDATLVTTAATVTGKLDGDALTVSATGTFDNANVGENKTVTISELTFGGSSKDNYKLASTGSQTTTTAKITAKAVGLTWSNTELAYTGEAQKPTATATGVVDGDTCTVTVSGEQTNVGDDYTATAASLSNSNYKLPENKTTTFKIVKGNAVPVTVTANNRTYDGTEKPLVTVTGEATGGEMQYALGTATEATGSYTTSIPAKTDAGTYYVWYKVKGDGNHNDTEPKPISVTISNPAPSHTHNWGDWEVTKKATCVAKGEKKRTCSDCKKEEKQEIDIDPANHVNTEIRDAKEATETEEGYTGDTWCKDCDVKLESGKSIPKLEKKQEEKTDNQKEEKKAFTDFRTLRLVAKRGTKSVNLTWRKYADADGYLIYGCECGAGSKMKLLKTIKGNKTVKWTQKKLKKGTYYKYKVVAYKNNKGKKQTLVTSKEAHTVTHDGKTTAVKAVKVNKTSVSLKKGKTFQIKASEVKENKKKKIDHHREIRYESSNKKIATVAKNGKVKGVKKGTATIFVYSETGSYKTVKVTVK